MGPLTRRRIHAFFSAALVAACVAGVALIASTPTAHATTAGVFVLDRAATAQARIGPGAVWSQAAKGGQVGAFESCGSTISSTKAYQACVARYMAAHGASAAAVAFFEATDTYLIRYLDTGEVDFGYTLSGHPMSGGFVFYVLLNGEPPYMVPKAPSLVTPAYLPLQAAFARANGFRPGTDPLEDFGRAPDLQAANRLPGGGEEMQLQFPLTTCTACGTAYRAQLTLRFSAAGALSGSLNEGPCVGLGPGTEVLVKEPSCPKVLATV